MFCLSNIYNLTELNEKYNLNSNNACELIESLMSLKKISFLDDIDGDYSFAFIDNKKTYLIRDIIGLKPLFYSFNENNLYYSFDKKVLSTKNLDVKELDPRKILIYNNGKISFKKRDFFKVKLLKEKEEIIKKKLLGKLINSISKRLPNQEFGILFSGGIDSLFIAKVCKDLGLNFTCYTAALKDSNSEDVIYAKMAAKHFGFKLKIVEVKEDKVNDYAKKVVDLLGETNFVKVSVGIPIYVACEKAYKDEIKFMFSGLGSEEIFAGYQRHKDSKNINKECLNGLLLMYERDCFRDWVISNHFGIDLRCPFLDNSLIEYSIGIPSKFKINDKACKLILRKVALDYGIDEKFAFRRKLAAQYGSKFDKALMKLTKKKGFKFKGDYINSLK